MKAQRNGVGARPLADLRDGNRGTRAIDDAAAAGLGYSLAEFGDLSGIVLGVVGRNGAGAALEKIAGHQRLAQLEAVGATQWTVLAQPAGGKDGAGYVEHPKTGARFPVRIVDWPASKRTAARYAANSQKIAGGFTALALPELAALTALPGLAPLRLDALADDLRAEFPEPRPPEDEPPEPPAVAVSRRGDLWLLGEHGLACGDSTKAEDVARVMGGERAVLMATDPPYCVGYDAARKGGRFQKGSIGTNRHVAYRDLRQQDWPSFVRSWLPGPLSDHAAVYVWHADIGAQALVRAMEEAGIKPHQLIVWCKPHVLGGYAFYDRQAEFAWFGWFGGRPGATGLRVSNAEYPGSAVWHTPDHKRGQGPGLEGGEHPAIRPTETYAKPIRLHARPGEVCYEPFSGSGTQIVAAEQLGRRCFALEIEPRYVDVAVVRWARVTGREARLALPDGSPGGTFAEVARERGVTVPVPAPAPAA